MTLVQFQVLLAVGLGGFVGAVGRFLLSAALAGAFGESLVFVRTLVVNLIGCFAIGVVTVIAARTSGLSPVMQKCVITGLLGAFTTFSTFAMDSLILLQSGRFGAAGFNIGVNVVAGLLLVWLGMTLAQWCIALPIHDQAG
ncbi:MAG: fluoride efflux transporter CrcB [Planctomycetaceae bacterium]|nr:fluoride efflux transporter CrcB [Planctomycetaceae bacterium]